MIKSRTAQIVFEAIYVLIGFIGIIGSLGYFQRSFSNNFYIMYTNLSNYICIGFIVYLLINRVKDKTNSLINKNNVFNFLCVILILVTFLIYNILLAKQYSFLDYMFNFTGVIMHIILPLMFIIHWVLFTERKKLKPYHPLMATIMPLIYVAFIMIRARILKGSDKLLYPYFFLDIEKLGVLKFFMWIIILVIIFIVIGYLLFLYDNKKKCKIED